MQPVVRLTVATSTQQHSWSVEVGVHVYTFLKVCLCVKLDTPPPHRRWVVGLSGCVLAGPTVVGCAHDTQPLAEDSRPYLE